MAETLTISEFTNPSGVYVYQVMRRGMPITRELDGYEEALALALGIAGEFRPVAEINRYFGDTGVLASR